MVMQVYSGFSSTHASISIKQNERSVHKAGKGNSGTEGHGKGLEEQVYRDRNKKRVLETCVFSILLYGCEAWVVTKETEQRIMAFERKCYRKILRIGWTQKVKNIDLYGRIYM